MNVNRPLFGDFEKSGWQKGPKGRNDGKVRLEGRQDCLQIWGHSVFFKDRNACFKRRLFYRRGREGVSPSPLGIGARHDGRNLYRRIFFWERSASSEGTANEGVPRKIVFMG